MVATDAVRWNALVRRDPRADGIFYYAVLTTGVYCRPTCRSRLPRRENVTFHATTAAAEQAGYRPCKRCRPREASLARARTDAIIRACRKLDRADAPIRLADLARDANISSDRFQRLFRASVGLTPKQYFDAARRSRVRRRLARNESITRAVLDAGYGSTGRFYAKAAAMLGMTPSTYRRGGEGAHVRYAIGRSTLGLVLVATTDKGICAIDLGDDRALLVASLTSRFARAVVSADRRLATQLRRTVAFADSPSTALDLPLDIRGTAFQERVWRELRRIRVGSTASYAEIARRIDAPGSARAVARACASNPLALVVPCHRVVRSSGELAGYRWGLERKREILRRERAK